MRIYYINKFKYNGNVSELMMKAYNSYLKREMIQTFKDRLITMRRLMMKRSIKEPPK